MENIKSRIKAILEKDQDNSELSTFITSLLENSSPAYYLKSGLSRKNSYNDTLTPSIFIKYFYVERTRENGISELSFVKTQIEKLFRNQNYNVMALRSFRGSGKSVFVNILASEYSSNEYKVVKIDLEQGEYDYTDSMLFTNILTELMQFHHKEIYETGISENPDFFKIYEKLLKQIFSIERVTQNFFVVDNHSYLEEIWNKLEELNKLEKNRYNTIDIYQTEARQKFLSNDEITSNEEKRRAVLFFYFIVTIVAILAKELYENKYDPNGELKISGIALNSALRHKYLFIFDNIEAYNSSRAGTVYQVIKNIHSALRRTFYGLGIEEKFFTHFECIIALRTRTSIALHDSQRGENIIYKTYDLGTPDFFDGALLAKYKFLYKLNQKVSGLLRATELYSIVEHVCQFFFPQSEIDKYLEDDNTMIGKKVFINEKFAPFFAYDFRKMSEEVGRALLTNDYGTRIRTLLDSYTTEGINGARMILFRLIFDDFVDKGIFDAFGFHALDGQEKHSISRAILLYLFYNRKININLEFLLSVFIRIYSKSPEDFSNALWKLSQFNDSSENTSAPPIDEWGNLLEFTNIEGTIDNGRLSNLVFNYFKNPSSKYQMNATPISDIGVKITKTGECFINYISKQFEFFASRIKEPKSALFAFEIDSMSAVENVKNYINEMFLAIKTYTNAMINNGQKLCQFFKGEPKRTCPIGKSFLQNERICSYFQRTQEVWGLLKENINYIDRYRLFILSEINNRGQADGSVYSKDTLKAYFNKKILFEIKKFANLLIEQHEYSKKMDCRKKVDDYTKKSFDSVITPTPDHLKSTKKIDEIDGVDEDGDILSLTAFDIYTSPYYYYFEGKDAILIAINKCEYYPEKSIYDICKEMYLMYKD